MTFSYSSQIIKYGVISTESLIDDLMHWKTMYVAGRLHKPVSIKINCFGSIRKTELNILLCNHFLDTLLFVKYFRYFDQVI